MVAVSEWRAYSEPIEQAVGIVRVDTRSDDTVERVAEALHDLEYPRWSATAVRDHNRWSWRGAGDDPSDPKPAMGFIGDDGSTEHYDEYRRQARAVLLSLTQDGDLT